MVRGCGECSALQPFRCESLEVTAIILLVIYCGEGGHIPEIASLTNRMFLGRLISVNLSSCKFDLV